MSKNESLDLKTVVRQNPTFYLGRVDDEYMLMSLATGETHSLNSVAARIWKKMETPVSIGTLSQWVMNEYKLESSQSKKDLLAVCQSMLLYKTLLIEKGDCYETTP